jgi:hypothetical protein
MENPVLVITESRDQSVDHQLAKSIGSGSIVQQSRGTPIIDELWHGTIAPSELEKGARYKEYGGHTAGEGSRGGHVIGHTKSGKPVYRGTINQKDGKTFPAGHEEYSKQDHLDAAEAHQKVSMIQPEDYSDNGNVLHQDLARKHREMANGEKPKHYSPPEGSAFAGKSLRVNDAINSLTSIFKAEEIEDEDEEPEEKFKKKDDEKETEKSELSFYIDLVKAEDGEKDDSQMTDAEAEGAADREANKDDSEDEDEESEKSVSSALNDLIKAAGKKFEADEKKPADFKKIEPEEKPADFKPPVQAEAKPLVKGTAMGVPEIKVDEYGIPLYEGNAFEVHDDADKNTVRELINAGLVGDPEHAMDKRIPQVINRVLGGVY